jgi:hypothetical protein
LFSIFLAGCSRVEPGSNPTPDPAPAASKPAASAPRVSSSPLVLAHGIRFVKAGPENDVPKLVRGEREKAAADGRDLLVYVGAKWCEPCRNFHAAALHGDLDGDFPDLNILEFDLDEDRDRINIAGYDSKLIPLFVYPGADGRGTERRFEGSIKGPGAAANIVPRLRQLLAR